LVVTEEDFLVGTFVVVDVGVVGGVCECLVDDFIVDVADCFCLCCVVCEGTFGLCLELASCVVGFWPDFGIVGDNGGDECSCTVALPCDSVIGVDDELDWSLF